MAITTKVIVQHHERTSLSNMDTDLELRELGFVSDTNSIRINDNADAKHSVWTHDSSAPVYDNNLTLSKGLTSGNTYLVTSKTVLDDAITAASTNDSTFIIVGDIVLTGSVALASNISVIVQNGGLFSGAYTVTFNGTFSGGHHTSFSSSTTVVFASGSIDYGLAEWWGAVGDGIVDDVSAINKAIVACSRVKLLDKTYAIGSKILLKTDSELFGMGIDRSILLEKDDFTATIGTGIMVEGTSLANCYYHDFYVKGTATSSDGVSPDRYGINITTSTLVKVDSVKVSNTERGIFFWKGNTDCWLTNCYATSCYTDALGSFGETGSNQENLRMTITGNKAVSNPVGASSYPSGIRLEETYNSTVANNISSINGQGLRIENSSQNSITGNTCYLNDKNGIQLYNSSKRNTVTGNTCYDNNTGYITSKGSINAFSVGAAGTGYSVNDILALTLPVDTGAIYAAVKVLTIGGSGEVTAVTMDANETTYDPPGDTFTTGVNRGWHYATGTLATVGFTGSGPSSGSGCTISVDSVASRISANTPGRSGNSAKSYSGIELQNDCQNNTITGNNCFNSTTGKQFDGITINSRNFADLTEASSYNVVSSNICVGNDVAQISDRGLYNQVQNNTLVLNNE